MLPTRLLLLLVFSLVNTAAWATVGGSGQAGQAVLPAIPSRFAGPQDVVTASVAATGHDLHAIQLQIDVPETATETVDFAGASMSWVHMNGEAVRELPGAPEVPRIVRMIMIDGQGNYQFNVGDLEFSTSTLPYPPAPHVPLAEGATALDETVALRAEYYEHNDWYPANVVEVSEPATIRDVRFVLVTINPVQVNPVTREVRTYSHVDVTLQNVGGAGVNELTHVPEYLSPSFKELYRTIPNFEGSSLDALPVMPGRHLYICDPNATVVGLVQTLVDWRRKRGYDAYIATTTQTGTSATSIRTYIQNQFDSGNGALEYVTLVGDPDAAAPHALATGTALDNTYATIGDINPDPVPDIAVGRLPSTGNLNLQTMIENIISYESDPYMAETDWFERAWCAAHTSQVPSNPSTKQYMRQLMLQHGVPTVDFDVFEGGMSTPTLEARLEAGVCVFNDRMSWIGEFNSGQLAGVAVNEQWPFAWVVTCATGTFGGGASLNEDFVRGGHSIGCVGMSGAGTHSRYNNILDGGGMQTLFALDARETGIALIGAKLELYRNYWSVGGGSEQGDVTNFAAWCNLQGDPGVPVYLDTPHILTVVHPASIARGTNNIGITVSAGGNPVANALVGLTKGAETFARGYTDANGQINLAVGTPTTGTMNIVVSGKDLKAYVSTINVVDVGASLSYSSIAIDDDNVSGTVGDNNDILNPGETVDLSIVLQNTGTANTVTGISGTLTSSSPGVTIISGVQSYPNIGVGATAAPTAAYRIGVGAVFHHEPVVLFLSLSSSAGTQSVRVDLTPDAASAAFSVSAFPDGNNRLDPGDSGNYTVTLLNDGSRALSGAAGVLRSLSSYVTVSDSLGTYGNVNAGATAANAGNPYVITAVSHAPAGMQVPFQLVVTDANGVRDSVTFLQTIGIAAPTSPTGPDAYGYIAYENGDLQPAGAAPLYDWIEIAPGLGGTGQSLGFTDGGEDQDDVTTHVLPFTFRYYGQDYDTITICSNGWISFGTTTQIDYRNFHMGSPLGPPNQIAAYWDDLIVSGVANGGVYLMDDAANGRVIIEWRVQCLWASGTAPQTFQVILYDPSGYPSPTGDGKILVQYQDVNPHANSISFDNDFATVGIQNINHTSGLEICYWNAYTPGSTTLADGRAIMFTTDITGAIDPTFALLSPNGGELWLQDSTVSILWAPGLVTGNVNIDLSRNGAGGPWSSLAANTTNDGQFTWVVNGASSAACRIRITSVNTPDSTDMSPADFTIASVVMLLSESFESGAPGWTEEAAVGWSEQWHVSVEQARTGTHSYKCGDTGTGTYANLQDARLISPILTALPSDVVLEFWHTIDSEVSTASPDSAYDGGWVEISVNGGAYTTITPAEGYPKTTRWFAGGTNPYSGPVPLQPCYAGTITNWAQEHFDLAAFAGSDVQLRWRFGSDAGVNREGWYVDDVQAYHIGSIAAVHVPTGLTVQVSGSDVILRWDDDDNFGYRVYSSITSDQPFPTLVGETLTNSLTLPGAATDPLRFYYVVGWTGQ